MKFTCADFAARAISSDLGARTVGEANENAPKPGKAGDSAGLFELAALNVAVSLEHQPQAVEREVFVVVLDGAQVGQHQRRGVPGGHHCDVVTAEAVDVL